MEVESIEILVKDIQEITKEINNKLGKLKILEDSADTGRKSYKIDEWVSPLSYKTITLGDLIYKEPITWEKKNAAPREGTYYYPYFKSVRSQIWITRMKHDVFIKARDDFERFYKGFIEGLCENDHQLVSSEDITLKSLDGKKYRVNMNLANGIYEVDLYCFVKDFYLYVFSFGEKGNISDNLLDYEKEFLYGYKWR